MRSCTPHIQSSDAREHVGLLRLTLLHASRCVQSSHVGRILELDRHANEDWTVERLTSLVLDFALLTFGQVLLKGGVLISRPRGEGARASRRWIFKLDLR